MNFSPLRSSYFCFFSILILSSCGDSENRKKSSRFRDRSGSSSNNHYTKNSNMRDLPSNAAEAEQMRNELLEGLVANDSLSKFLPRQNRQQSLSAAPVESAPSRLDTLPEIEDSNNQSRASEPLALNNLPRPPSDLNVDPASSWPPVNQRESVEDDSDVPSQSDTFVTGSTAIFKSSLESLCSQFKQREVVVNKTTTGTSLVGRDLPGDKLPSSLTQKREGYYSWYVYATPSRDAKIRAEIVKLRKLVKSNSSFRSEFRKLHQNMASSCSISYFKSDKKKKKLSFNQLIDRSFKMSFDPYHCSELRWGATGEELVSCQKNNDNFEDQLAWYQAQKEFRNSFNVSLYPANTAFTMAQLSKRQTAKVKADFLKSSDYRNLLD